MFVSILGDSISTFEGYNPASYAVFYDKQNQTQNGLASVYDTWWAKVNQYLHAYLCVNNAYSGSRVSGSGFPSAWCDSRLFDLRADDCEPDIILVYLGFNDFGFGVQVAKKRSLFFPRKDMTVFDDAYGHMLVRITTLYPQSRIICGTLMRTHIRGRPEWRFPEAWGGIPFEDYNQAIRKNCKREKCILADLDKLGLQYETLDGAHPTVEGHRVIASAWIKCLEACDVTREGCALYVNRSRSVPVGALK